MPNTKSAIRRVRRVKRQTSVNKIRKSKFKSAVKHMETLIKKGDKKKAKDYFPKFQSILMQVAKLALQTKKLQLENFKNIKKNLN